jgi:ABC-type multidrug transport system permease subunit
VRAGIPLPLILWHDLDEPSISGTTGIRAGYSMRRTRPAIGALFFFTINQTFGNMFAVLDSFSSEKVIVERERAAKSYRLSSFYLGKLTAELPLNLISPLVFGSIVYWLIGLNDAPGRFFFFLLILVETGLAAIGLGMAVAAAAPSVQVRHDETIELFCNGRSVMCVMYTREQPLA